MRRWAAAALLALAACAARTARAPLPAPPPPAPPAPPAAAVNRADPAELKRLYDAALEAYAKERRDEAARLFRRMLELDPANEAAKKGLRRLALEP